MIQFSNKLLILKSLSEETRTKTLCQYILYYVMRHALNGLEIKCIFNFQDLGRGIEPGTLHSVKDKESWHGESTWIFCCPTWSVGLEGKHRIFLLRSSSCIFSQLNWGDLARGSSRSTNMSLEDLFFWVKYLKIGICLQRYSAFLRVYEPAKLPSRDCQ